MKFIEPKYSTSEFLDFALWANLESEKALLSTSRWKFGLWDSDTFDSPKSKSPRHMTEAVGIIKTGGYKFLILYFKTQITYLLSNFEYLNIRLVSLLPKNQFLIGNFLNLHQNALVFNEKLFPRILKTRLNAALKSKAKDKANEWYWLYDYRQHTLTPDTYIVELEPVLTTKRQRKKAFGGKGKNLKQKDDILNDLQAKIVENHCIDEKDKQDNDEVKGNYRIDESNAKVNREWAVKICDDDIGKSCENSFGKISDDNVVKISDDEFDPSINPGDRQLKSLESIIRHFLQQLQRLRLEFSRVGHNN